MTPKQASDLRRLGTALLLGVVAGAGVRYYLHTRTRDHAQRPSQLIDWEQARSVALRVSQWKDHPVLDRAMREEQYSELVQRSVPLISEYLNVHLPNPLEKVYVFDRREWLEANLKSFEHLFAPIEEIYLRNGGAKGPLSSVLGGWNSKIIGAEIGVLLGFLARRVLGQYDLSLLSPEPSVHGALYYVEPNIDRVQKSLGLNDEDFRLWIALHETTHAFEFEAYPWVREHFNGLVRRYFDQLNGQLDGLGTNLVEILVRVLEGNKQNKDGKHWIETVLTAEQRQLFDELQALMSLVEGYSNHMMNAIGRQLLPSFDQIEQRIEQRQRNKNLFELVFNRVTGMDLKLAQYQQGEAFVNAVVAERGIAFAAKVWEKAENLPNLNEIRNPHQWIARIDAQ